MAVILVIDGHGARPLPLQSRLIKEGYHTLGVRDAGEAAQTLKCVRADLLIVDVAVMDGGAHQLLATLRQDAAYRELPVLFVGAGLNDYRQLNPSVRPGAVLLRGQTPDDVILSVQSYVAPSLASRN